MAFHEISGSLKLSNSLQYVGKIGSLIIDTDTGSVFLNDGITVGGIPVFANSAAPISNYAVLAGLANSAVTQPLSDNSNNIATTAYVQGQNFVTNVITSLGYTPVNVTAIGVASGVASLDNTGRLSVSQIPTALVGALRFVGIWNATTNTPSIVSGSGSTGNVYVVGVAGSTPIDGNSQWNIGDELMFDGTVWQKIDGLAKEVISVAGRTGVITLSVSDVAGALNNTNTSVVLTGDILGSATYSGNNVSIATNLASVNGNTGVFGNASQVVALTVNAKGLITAVSNINISYPITSVAGRTGDVVLNASDISGIAPINSPALTGVPTAPTPLLNDSSNSIATTAFVQKQNFLVSPIVAYGDASGTGSGNTIALTLTSINSDVGTYGSATDVAVLSVNDKGLITAISNVSIDALTALGYTPLNSSNATITIQGDVTGSGNFFGNAALISASLAPSYTAGTYSAPIVDDRGLVVGSSNLAFVGDVSGASAGPLIVLTLANVVTSGTVGSSTVVPVITFNNKGLVTSVTGAPIAFPQTSLLASGDVTGRASANAIVLTLSLVGSVGTYSSVVTDSKGRVVSGTNITAIGDATGSVTGSTLALTLATVADAATTGTSTTVPVVTINQKGLVTSLTETDIAFPETALTVTGDVTGTAAANVIVLDLISVGNVGTYSSVVTDNNGRVVSGTNISVTGDVTGTVVSAGLNLTLDTVNGNVGSFGDSTQVPTLTVNAKGLITAATNTPIYYPVTSIFGRLGDVVLESTDVTDALGFTPQGNMIVSGDVTGTSTQNAITLTLIDSGVTAGSYGSATQVASVIFDLNGRAVAASDISINFPVTSIFGRLGDVVLESTDVIGALGYIPVNNAVVGAVSGVATLDSSGRLTASQIPSGIVGATVYQGTWDAFTNTPTLVSGIGSKGNLYKVNNAGSTSIDGISTWNVGDEIVFDGNTWDKIDGLQSEVVTVAGRTGAVVLSVSDVLGAAPLLSPVLTGNPTSPTPSFFDNSNSIATTSYVQEQNYTVAPIVVSGDGSGTAVNNNTITLTLATVNGNAGSYGSATQVPAFTVNAKGLITSVSNIAFSIPVTSVAGRIGNVILSVSDVSGAAPLLSPALTGNPTAVTVSLSDNSNSIATTAYVKDQNYTVAPIVVSGDVLGTASGNAITLNLATSGVVSGTYGSATQVPALVVNAKGLVTSISNVAFSIPVTSVAGRIGNVILSVTDVANAVSNVAPTFTGLSTFVSGTFTATLGVAGATTLANMTANSGVFTTQLTSPTPVSGDNTSNVATTAYVTNMISYNSANVAITGGMISGVTITGGSWAAQSTPTPGKFVSGISYYPYEGYFVAFSNTSQIYYSIDGLNWSGYSTGLSNQNWTAASFSQTVTGGTSVVVAAGTTSAGYLAYYEGFYFLPMTMPSAAAWSSVANNSNAISTGTFVAVAYNSNTAAWTTSTGWTLISLPSVSNWTSITSNGTGFVAVASGGTTAAYSPTGTSNFIASTLPTSANWSSVTYANGLYVAVAANSTASAYSTNGVTWNAAILPSASAWSSVSYGNGLFVAISNGNAAAYSVDAIHWIAGTLPSNQAWTGIAFNPTTATFSAVSLSNTVMSGNPSTILSTANATGNYAKIVSPALSGIPTAPTAPYYTSSTQIATTAMVQSVLPTAGITAGTINNTPIGYSTANAAAFTSMAVGTWTSHTMAITAVAVAYGNSVIVAIGSTTSGAYSTNGGLTWTTTTLPNPTPGTWIGLTYGNGMFVATSQSGTAAMYSTNNGQTWTLTTLPYSGSWTSVAYANGLFVSLYAGTGGVPVGNTVVSTNGITWSNGTSLNSIFNLRSGNILSCNGLFFGSGWYQNLVYSTDGINWTPVTGTVPGALLPNSMAYGNGVYVAIGSTSWGGPNLSYSFNGAYWYPANLPSVLTGGSSFYVVFANSYFYAVSNGKTTLISSDGINWGIGPTLPSSFSNTLGLFFVNGNFISGASTSVYLLTNFSALMANAMVAPTVAIGDNTSNVATTAFVQSQGFLVNTSSISGTFVVTTMPSSQNWQQLTYGNGVTMAIANTGQTAISTNNGTTWTAGGNIPSQNAGNLSYCSNAFVAVSQNSTTVSISTNMGATWANSGSFSSSIHSPSALVCGNGYIVIANANQVVFSANNGSSWTLDGLLPGGVVNPMLAFGNGVFVALPSNTGVNANSAISINNATSWVVSPLPTNNTITWQSLVFGNGMFIALSNTATSIYAPFVSNGVYSVGWNATTAIPTGANGYVLSYGNGYWVAVNATTSQVSLNGLTWTSGPAVSTPVHSMINVNGTFVGVANSNSALLGTFSSSNSLVITAPLSANTGAFSTQLTSVTPSTGDNTTNVATTAFVETAVTSPREATFTSLITPIQYILPSTAPATPATGFVLYVDSADNTLKAMGANGTITIIALP